MTALCMVTTAAVVPFTCVETLCISEAIGVVSTVHENVVDIILGFKQNAFKNNWDVDVIPVNPTFQLQEKYDTYMLKCGYSGAFIVGFLNNIMNLTSVNSYLQQIIKGAIIALAVIYDIYAKSRRTRKKMGNIEDKAEKK